MLRFRSARNHSVQNLSSRKPSRQSGTATAKGTMTLKEKELFSKIFQSILARKPEVREPEKNNPTHTWDGPVLESSAASSEHDKASRAAARDFLTAFPPTLQAEAQQAEIIVRQKEYKDQTRQKAIEERSNPSYVEVRERLNSCMSLRSVLDFAQNNLFGPFLEGVVSLEAISSLNRKKTRELTNFCHIYPLLLRDTMSILRLSYKNYSAAVYIFERAKELGVVSQVIGINTAVYNELLLNYFEGWNQLSLVLKTLTDMELDGIEPDEYTASVLRKIKSEILSQRSGSKACQLIWSQEKAVKLENLSKASYTIEKKFELLAYS